MRLDDDMEMHGVDERQVRAAKLNKDVYTDAADAVRAFTRYCKASEYCKHCALFSSDSCGVAWLYLPAPRRGRPPKKNGELRMENGKCGGAKWVENGKWRMENDVF